MDLLQKAISLGFVPINKDYYLWEIQRWLGEEHKLFVIVGLSFEHKFYVTIYDRNYEYELDTIKNKLFLDSSFALYEEALEAGLTKALKLIP